MNNIKKIVTGIEEFKIELENVDPDFYEKEFMGGATETFIVLPVENKGLKVFFSEYDSVKKVRDEIYEGTKTKDDLIEDLSNKNDLDEQFDFENVVAYKNSREIEWL